MATLGHVRLVLASDIEAAITAVASSRMSTGGLRSWMRAIAMRCFSQPEKR